MKTKKNLLQRPDINSIAPLYSILPNLGDEQALHDHAEAMFARYERTRAALADSNSIKSSDDQQAKSAVSEDFIRQQRQRLTAEEGMLSVVLKFLDYEI